MKHSLIAALLFALSASAADRESFDFGWKFHQGEAEGAEQPAFDDVDWRDLDLPHDFSIEQGIDEDNPSGRRGGWYAAGTGWYRKEFEFSRNWKDKKVVIYFEGVYRNSTVWINGHKLGTRPYGYISFFYDLTDHLEEGSNLIAVRVDNTAQPSDRWYSGSGIYRHVWLVVSEKVHIPIWGTQVTTRRITQDSGHVVVKTSVTNEAAESRSIKLETTIVDADGETVATTTTKADIDAGQQEEFTSELVVEKPQRWSPDEPNLYTVKNIVKSGLFQRDEHQTPLGFRTITWDPKRGFVLNGRPTLLKGVSQHHDYGPLGAAEFDDICEARILQLKKMGCNAMRTAHNPFSPTFMDACDRLGMLVMDECFDGWHKKAGQDYGALHFAEWWQRDLRDFILRDRNHPSVFIWSIGNETGHHDEHDMTGFIRELDSTRKTTGGHVQTGVDIPGFNGPGGAPGFFEGEIPGNRPVIFTEVPHTYSSRGVYRTQTYLRDQNKPHYPVENLTDEEVFLGDWSSNHIYRVTYNSNYDNAHVRINIRRSWQHTRDHNWVCGEFRWTGHDYLGESFGWPMRGLKNGIIDACNFEKDVYYLYQSLWTDEPMLHILPHWTHPHVPEGTEIPVYVYSNCDEVELIVNSRSLGIDRPGTDWNEMQCDWMVPWKPGELMAVGRRGGEVIVKSVRTTKEPSELLLECDRTELPPDGHAIAQVTIKATDEKGGFAPLARNRVHVHLSEGARLQALGNGDAFDHEITTGASNRKLMSGLCRAFVRSIRDNDEPVVLTAAAILGDRTLKQSDRVHIDLQTLAIRGKADDPEIQILYSTDGSEPSEKYRYRFPVEEGTTVKAVVLADEEELFRMEETFSATNWITYKASEVSP